MCQKTNHCFLWTLVILSEPSDGQTEATLMKTTTEKKNSYENKDKCDISVCVGSHACVGNSCRDDSSKHQHAANGCTHQELRRETNLKSCDQSQDNRDRSVALNRTWWFYFTSAQQNEAKISKFVQLWSGGGAMVLSLIRNSHPDVLASVTSSIFNNQHICFLPVLTTIRATRFSLMAP